MLDDLVPIRTSRQRAPTPLQASRLTFERFVRRPPRRKQARYPVSAAEKPEEAFAAVGHSSVYVVFICFLVKEVSVVEVHPVTIDEQLVILLFREGLQPS